MTEVANPRDSVRATPSIGIARATITPPLGIEMIGFADRGVADAVHDDLTATALVWSTSGAEHHRVAMVFCDLLWFDDTVSEQVRTRVSKRTSLDFEDVLLFASHNHYGPVAGAGIDPIRTNELVPPYLAGLADTIADIVAEALHRSRTVRVSVGWGTADINVNRREETADGTIVLGTNPTGAADKDLLVVRIDDADGRPQAVILNYQCHLVTLGGSCRSITADFAAIARDVVEQETGATCVFLQGAAGDLNPRRMGMDWDNVAALGTELGTAALRAWGKAEPQSPVPLARATRQLKLSPLLPESEDAAFAEVDEFAETLRHGAQVHDTHHLDWVAMRLLRVSAGIATLRGERQPPPVIAEINGVRLTADLALATAPAEMFNEIGRDIRRRSPFRHTLYGAYANGMVHYIPTAEAHDRGGYEVTHGCIVARGSAERVADCTVDLLDSVHE